MVAIGVDGETLMGYHTGMSKAPAQPTKTFEIDVVVKVTLTAPAATTDDEAVDALCFMVVKPDKAGFKIDNSEVVDADVVNSK